MLIGVAAAQTTGGVPAVTPSPGSPTSRDDSVPLSSLDTDKDGSISKMEAEANRDLTKQFPGLDLNGNGALEPAEFARFETEASPASPGSGPGGPSQTPGRNGAGVRRP